MDGQDSGAERGRQTHDRQCPVPFPRSRASARAHTQVWVCVAFGTPGLSCTLGSGAAPLLPAAAAAAAAAAGWMQCFRFNESSLAFDFWVSGGLARSQSSLRIVSICLIHFWRCCLFLFDMGV